MEELGSGATLVAAGTAFWLGVLTSISPCPLASNIAAISYVGKGLAKPRRVLAAGVLYTAGRVLTYALLGWLLAASLASIAGVSNNLQGVMNQLLGPILILAGMFMLELLRFGRGSGTAGGRVAEMAAAWGLGGAVALGALFALSFCPVSAALFFGSLIPLAVSSASPVIMPSLYGVGTGLPVLAFAALFSLGAGALSRSFERITRLELWARRVTGVVFILVGLYYALNYVFEVLP
ncbi:MAG: sulfite exporter TauE/SafE family protein [Bryobacteraceae bacterium]|nr:sulfite exporter TauE/SafE family protein [Bryobacteraceae bacterium]